MSGTTRLGGDPVTTPVPPILAAQAILTTGKVKTNKTQNFQEKWSHWEILLLITKINAKSCFNNTYINFKNHNIAYKFGKVGKFQKIKFIY